MWDNTDKQDSAGYSDMLTDLGFFEIALMFCALLAAIIVMVLV